MRRYRSAEPSASPARLRRAFARAGSTSPRARLRRARERSPHRARPCARRGSRARSGPRRSRPADRPRERARRPRSEDRLAGALLFREGDPPGEIYVVLSGRVSLGVHMGARGEAIVLSLGEGELLGWSSLLARKRVATARVTHSVRLICIGASELLELCERDASVGYAIMSAAFEEVADRLHATRLQLLDLYGRGG